MKKLLFYFQSIRTAALRKPLCVFLTAFSVFAMTIVTAFACRQFSGEYGAYLYPGRFDAVINEFQPQKTAALLVEAEAETDRDAEWWVRFDYEDKKGNIFSADCNLLFRGAGGVSESDVAEGAAVMAVSKKYAELSGLNTGDFHDFFGTRYTIVEIYTDTSMQIGELVSCGIPYSALPRDFDYDPALANIEDDQARREALKDKNFPYMRLLIYPSGEDFYLKGYEEKFKAAGITIERNDITGPSLTILAILIGACLLSALNIVGIFKYYSFVHRKRFTVYKTVGARNGTIAAAMYAEMIFSALVAFGLGLLFDFVLANILLDGSNIGSMLSICYWIMLALNVGTLCAATGAGVWRRARAMPADRRFS